MVVSTVHVSDCLAVVLCLALVSPGCGLACSRAPALSGEHFEGEIRGRVNGPHGPVANVTVFLREHAETLHPADVIDDGSVRARTSASGEFRMTARPGLYHMYTNLLFAEPGYLPHEPVLVRVKEGRIVHQDLILIEGLLIRGRLVGPDREPVASRPLVRAFASIPMPSRDTWLTFQVVSRAGPNGEFCIGGFPEGIFELAVEVAGTPTARRYDSARVVAAAGDQHVEFALPHRKEPRPP